jgi:hypothetical protein
MDELKNENTDPVCKAIAEQWVGKVCWVNGHPAKVLGRLKRFATIASDNGLVSVEYSWHTVNTIMRTHKEFST